MTSVVLLSMATHRKWTPETVSESSPLSTVYTGVTKTMETLNRFRLAPGPPKQIELSASPVTLRRRAAVSSSSRQVTRMTLPASASHAAEFLGAQNLAARSGKGVPATEGTLTRSGFVELEGNP